MVPKSVARKAISSVCNKPTAAGLQRISESNEHGGLDHEALLVNTEKSGGNDSAIITSKLSKPLDRFGPVTSRCLETIYASKETEIKASNRGLFLILLIKEESTESPTNMGEKYYQNPFHEYCLHAILPIYHTEPAFLLDYDQP
jgi:hypothetical protein